SGSGASLRDEGRARAAVALAVAGLIGTIALVVFRRRSGALLTAGICAFALVLGLAGIVIYPRGTNARLVSLDPATGNERWSIHTRSVFLSLVCWMKMSCSGGSAASAVCGDLK